MFPDESSDEEKGMSEVEMEWSKTEMANNDLGEARKTEDHSGTETDLQNYGKINPISDVLPLKSFT